MNRTSDYHSGLQAVEHSGLHVDDSTTKPEPLWSIAPARKPLEDTTTSASQEPYRQSRDTIGGLRPVAFWIVMLLIAVLVVVASVGGAIGGTRASQKAASNLDAPQQSSSTATLSSSAAGVTSSSSTTTSSSQSTTIPTLGFRDCPNSNGTLYTAANPLTGQPLPSKFRKICSHAFNDGGEPLVSAFVITFDACIALCSNFNFWQARVGSTLRCTNVNYGFGGVYPNNCWASNVSLALNADPGSDCAQVVQ